ncbi:MAG: hypothetical protein KGQ59_09685 [Bdellovibrionales bacterium]|nr:hypothetical protein [Bdellovibrionales bacterium]
MSSRVFETLACKTGHTLRDSVSHQSMHSLIGPTLEAQLIYLEPSMLGERLQKDASEPLVLWDVGMGIAANSIESLKLSLNSDSKRPLEIHSFELHPEAIEKALDQPQEFAFVQDHARIIRQLLESGEAHWRSPNHLADNRWYLHRGDFKDYLDPVSQSIPPADLIFWDFYTPQSCPDLWSPELFTRVRSASPDSLLFTYSAATPVRVALLLAGFTVGHPSPQQQVTPMKLDATRAAARYSRRPELGELLNWEWIEKLKRSSRFRPYGNSSWARASSVTKILDAILQHEQFQIRSGG